jgi:putative oxidoreductase
MNTLLGPNISIGMLRMLMGLIFMAHGLARLVDCSLPDFGEFLDSKGFLAGFYLAWAVTIFDIVGGLLMVLRKFVKVFCVWEIIVLLT